jgi:hypothetical protein
MSSLGRLRSGLMSFRPLLKVLSQSVIITGITRVFKASGALPQASGTIILASRVSGPKESLTVAVGTMYLYIWGGHSDGEVCWKNKDYGRENFDYPITIPSGYITLGGIYTITTVTVFALHRITYLA